MKKLIALFLVLATVFAFAACSGDGKHETPTVTAETSSGAATNAEGRETDVTDMIGRELKILPGSYKKVVCIGAGALRMYSYIGDVSLLCGVEDVDNASLESRPKMFDASARPYVLAFGDVFSTLPSCGVGGPNAQSAESEKILSCGPDVVISEYEDVDKANALEEQLGVPVITLRTGPDGVFGEEFKGSMRLLGQVFDRNERAEELVSFVEKEIALIESRTASVKEEDKPSVYICGLGNWGTTDHLMTAENFAPFRAAHIKNAVSGLSAPAITKIDPEKFLSVGKEADLMIVDAAAIKNIAPAYSADPSVFESFKAWGNREVYLEMPYNAYYTNYEIALSNAWFIAKTAYPDLFTDIDMTAKTNEITKAFLGKELAEAIFAQPTSFGGYGKIDITEFFGDVK